MANFEKTHIVFHSGGYFLQNKCQSNHVGNHYSALLSQFSAKSWKLSLLQSLKSSDDIGISGRIFRHLINQLDQTVICHVISGDINLSQLN